jgi:Uma2 family endonuclease
MQAAEALTDYELERGKPMPSLNHARVQGRLVAALMRHDQDYDILPELSLELDGRPFTPDVSVFPNLPVDWLHDQIRKTEPPLLVVEILSPRQIMEDLIEKAEAYFAAGVKSCWIVLPALKTVVVIQPGDHLKVYTSGEISDPATGIEVGLEELFG